MFQRLHHPHRWCIINPKNQGAGIPDSAFFTADQLPRTGEPDLHAQLPARGVMEVKGTGDDAWQTVRSAQVARYLEMYGQVLVTNYRDFVLLGRDANGKRAEFETYCLAESETAFWAATTDPYALAETQGERCTEFLKRVLLYAAPLTNSADVAWFLASYARDARARIEGSDLPALTAVRTALEEALGVTFEGHKGDHFFRSTLVQTLFYGIFSAWVLWSKKRAPGNIAATFDWRITPWELHVPLIRGLFEQVALPSRLGPLGLVEVLDRTGAALNRVEPEVFLPASKQVRRCSIFTSPSWKPLTWSYARNWASGIRRLRLCTSSVTKLLDEKRAEYCPHVCDGNVWIVSQQKPRREWSEPQIIRSLGCLDIMDRSASCIPLYLTAAAARLALFDSGDNGKPKPNLSLEAVSYLSRFTCSEEDLFYYTLAILHAPTYRTENAGALRQDWSRVPLPGPAELLRASAALGQQVAALLDTERPVPGVTNGKICPEVQALGGHLARGRWHTQPRRW